MLYVLIRSVHLLFLDLACTDMKPNFRQGKGSHDELYWIISKSVVEHNESKL